MKTKPIIIALIAFVLLVCNAYSYIWSGKYWERDLEHPVFFNIKDQRSFPESGVKKQWWSHIKSAAKTWNEANANFKFEFNRYTTEGMVQTGHLWGNPDLAAFVQVDSMVGYPNILVMATTTFNLACVYTFSTNPRSGEIDVQSIALHEFGHWLKLLDDSVVVTNRMYYETFPDSIRRDLSADDSLGIKWIYPFSAWVSCSANVVGTDLPYEVVTGGSYLLGPVSNGSTWLWNGKLYDVPELTSLYMGMFDSHPWYGLVGIPSVTPLSVGSVQIAVDGSIVFTAQGIYSYRYTPIGGDHYYNIVETPQASLTNLKLPNYPQEVIVKWIAPTWPYQIPSGDTTLSLISVQQDLHYHTECYHPLNVFCRSKLINYNPTVLDSKIVNASDQFFSSKETDSKITEEEEINFINYPNPFYSKTEFSYYLPSSQSVNSVLLNIYNVLGQKVKTIIDGNKLHGKHIVVWDRLTDKGELAGNGIYICRLQIGENSYTKKIVILK
ncbi:T9SS type A sorting domain-containing protein [candidate division TA06 bacterium]|nr:T9SS type A sorting domain-containing protein [candidate division TA06 bacterium]